jgi:hypothetical protein
MWRPLNNKLVGVVRGTMQLAHTSLWLRPYTPFNDVARG